MGSWVVVALYAGARSTTLYGRLHPRRWQLGKDHLLEAVAPQGRHSLSPVPPTCCARLRYSYPGR